MKGLVEQTGRKKERRGKTRTGGEKTARKQWRQGNVRKVQQLSSPISKV